MQLPAIELTEYIDSEGIATFAGTTGWSLFAEQLPDEPDDVVVLSDIGGSLIATVCRVEVEDFRMQLLVRSNSYQDAYTKLLEVTDALEAIQHEVPTGMTNPPYYYVVYRNSLPTSIGRDKKNRALLSIGISGMRCAYPEGV